MIDLEQVDLTKGDPGDMLGRIRELPRQVRDAWDQVRQLELPPSYRDIENVLILGMGGSAIGGDLARALAQNYTGVPITVCREYDLPAYVNDFTLVIASSYSGNTEETLSAFQQAIERQAKVVVVSTGGKLTDLAGEMGTPIIPVRYKSSPRAAIGHSLVLLLGIFADLDLIPDPTPDLEEAIQVMMAMQPQLDLGTPLATNPAKSLALRLNGKLPVIYGAGLFSDVARRWKGQFNENAKHWSFFEVLPEANHNAILGYQFPAALARQLVVLFLTGPADHPRLRLRQQVTAEVLDKAGVPVEWIAAQGSSPAAQVFSLIHYGDYVSFYLSLLNQIDPSPVPLIDYLKRRLAESI